MIVYPVYKYYRSEAGGISWAQCKVFRTEAGRDEFLEEHSGLTMNGSGGQTWYEPWPIFEIEDK